MGITLKARLRRSSACSKGKQQPEYYEATLFNTKKEFEGA